jgi:hypothetical protein
VRHDAKPADPSGIGECHEVIAGNSQQVTTLTSMLDRLAARAGLAAGATVVMDHAMASREGIALLESRRLHYIVTSRPAERDRWLGAFADHAAFTQPLQRPSATNSRQKKNRADVQFVRGEGRNYILCRSEERIAKDKAIREGHERHWLADLQMLSQRIAEGRLTEANKIDEAIGRLQERYPRVARCYALSHDARSKSLLYRKLDGKYRAARQLDGTHLLETDRADISADEGWRIYSVLGRAEDAFRLCSRRLPSKRSSPISNSARRAASSSASWHCMCAWRSSRRCATRESTHPGQPFAPLSRRIRSRPSSCP